MGADCRAKGSPAVREGLRLEREPIHTPSPKAARMSPATKRMTFPFLAKVVACDPGKSSVGFNPESIYQKDLGNAEAVGPGAGGRNECPGAWGESQRRPVEAVSPQPKAGAAHFHQARVIQWHLPILLPSLILPKRPRGGIRRRTGSDGIGKHVGGNRS